MGVAALDGATDAVDTLVGLLGRQTLQGDLDSFVLFLEEIVVSGIRESIALARPGPILPNSIPAILFLKSFLLSPCHISFPPP